MNTNITGLSIKAIASCIPSEIFDIRSLYNEFGKNEIEKIIQNSGISKLRIAGKDVTTSDLCIRSTKQLFSEQIVSPKDIDGIVFVSQTPDYRMPPTSLLIQNKLGIDKNCICLDINYGCSAYIYGLFQAALLVSSGTCKTVLVCTGDVITRYINKKDRSLRVLFGDGASSTVVTSGNDSFYFDFYSDGSGWDKLIIPSGGSRYPTDENSKIVTQREDGNYRSDEDLYMNGIEIMNFALKNVPISIKKLCKYSSIDVNNIELFALHQANAFMLNYISRIMRLPKEKFPFALGEIGNTGPASIPLLLTEKKKDFQDNCMLNKVILCGFGVGLSCASMYLPLNNSMILDTVEFMATL